MEAQTRVDPWWAALTVWGVVNAVNVLQAAGFGSRVLFFGSILLMGLPMFRSDRRLWLVTVATTVLLLGSMGVAMHKGVG